MPAGKLFEVLCAFTGGQELLFVFRLGRIDERLGRILAYFLGVAHHKEDA